MLWVDIADRKEVGPARFAGGDDGLGVPGPGLGKPDLEPQGPGVGSGGEGKGDPRHFEKPHRDVMSQEGVPLLLGDPLVEVRGELQGVRPSKKYPIGLVHGHKGPAGQAIGVHQAQEVGRPLRAECCRVCLKPRGEDLRERSRQPRGCNPGNYGKDGCDDGGSCRSPLPDFVEGPCREQAEEGDQGPGGPPVDHEYPQHVRADTECGVEQAGDEKPQEGSAARAPADDHEEGVRGAGEPQEE